MAFKLFPIAVLLIGATIFGLAFLDHPTLDRAWEIVLSATMGVAALVLVFKR